MSLHNFTRILPEIALGFDDVLLEPAASGITPDKALIKSFFSRNIVLHLPFVITCNQAELRTETAIHIARLGGIGILPHDMAISKQAEMVRKVKRFQTRIVRDVITVTPDTLMAEVFEYKQRYNISCIPVIDPENRAVLDLLWLDDDVVLSADPNRNASDFHSGQELLLADDATALKDIHQLLEEKSAKAVILVDANKRCTGLVTKEDIDKARNFPLATLDNSGRICVAASVGVGEAHLDRVSALMDAGVDAIIVEADHGHNKTVLDMVTYIRRQRSGHVEVIAGNVVTSEAALALIDAGASGIKAGFGFDETCPLRGKSGVGIPQMTALMQVADACSIHQLPIIADGGIRSPADCAKALAAGAASVTLNGVLATMSDLPLEKSTASLTDSLQCAMSYTGCATLKEFNTRPRFVRIAPES